MKEINISYKQGDEYISVEDGEGNVIPPQEFFSSFPMGMVWNVKTIIDQLGPVEEVIAVIENYAKEKGIRFNRSVETLPNAAPPTTGAMSTFHEGGSTMNITKGRLKQIIQEELSREQVDDEV